MQQEPNNEQFSDLWTTSTVLFLALVLGALFNTEGIAAWAERKDISKWRDDLIVVTKRFHRRVSHLSLDAPRQILADRFAEIRDFSSGSKARNLAAKAPRSVAPATVDRHHATLKRSTQEMAWKRARASGRVLVAGDSMMHGALGKELKRQITESGLGEPYVRAEIATGLARPDYFDWAAEVRRLYATGPFGATIIMLGGNDTQNIEVDGKKYVFGSEGWRKVYRERVGSVARYICASTPKLFWVGAPLMRPSNYNRKVQIVNEIVKKEIERTSCSLFVPTVALMGGSKGYQSYLPVDGRLSKVRLNDGIHLTRSGGKIIARSLVQQLSRTPGFSPARR